MTFEEDFPSLKDKGFVTGFESKSTIITGNITMKKAKWEENHRYPFFVWRFTDKEIAETCLDKQRVREAIEEVLHDFCDVTRVDKLRTAIYNELGL